MFNGSLIDDLFAAVRKAEKAARPALPEETQSRKSSAESRPDFTDRQEANSEAE
jgi:hypothetical protein